MLQVRQKVTRTPKTFGEFTTDEVGFRMKGKPMRGVVVFVRPKGRFHVVEFANQRGDTIRETFDGV